MSIKKILLIAFIFIIGFAQAQHANSIKFSRLTIKDGLSQSTVNCILQDNQGYIWTGTQAGLNRFDGYHFKIYKQGLDSDNSLTNDYINALYQDNKGIIWIGTQNGGLNYYNPETKQFGNVKTSEVLESGNIKDIKEEADGSLWVATAKNGIVHFFPNEDRERQFRSNHGLQTNKTTSLFLDNKYVWIGTEGGGLCLLNKKTALVTHYKNEPNSTSSISDNNILTITKGFNDKVLIGTNNGLNIATINDNGLLFTTVKNHNGTQHSRFNVVSAIFPASENELWLGSQGNGLFRINMENGDTIINHYENNDYDRTSIPSNIVHSIISGRTGSVWIGTQDGISHFDPIKLGFQHYTYKYGDENSLNEKNVWSIYEGDDEIMWVGTRKGVSRLNLKKNQYNHYLYKTDNRNEPNNNNVYSITSDTLGRIWAGAAGGLYLLETSADFSTGEFIKIPFRDQITDQDDDRVYNLHIENDTTLWIACREGIAEINLSTLNYKFFSHENSSAMPKEECRVVYSDSRNDLWIGFDGGGVTKIKRTFKNSEEKYAFINYKNDPNSSTSISNNTILSIWEDNNNNIWFGTYGGGLNKFNSSTNTFSSYTEENGLSNNSIYGVLEGSENTLWVSTNFGLSKFNIGTSTFQNYQENDGLQSNEFNTGAYFRTSSGKLLFGGINGFNAFYPEDIQTNTIPPRVVLTDILLFNIPIEHEIDTIPEVSFIKTLQLKSTQNNLTFKFAALHYTFPEGNKYKVFLEGADHEAIELGDLQQINYSNLSPGEYTLKIWAANSDGIWTESPAVLDIVITPPFWKTWWFMSIGIGFILLVIYGFYIVRMRAMKSQKRKLAFLVEKRTKQITQQKEQMELQKAALEVEKDKSDKLLANILPAETAEELKNKGKAQTRYYRMVTVMFTDIQGFTKIAETIKPSELVIKLDSLFGKFDKIIEKHQIEKIKTIGDAYMAAGGVPLRDKENPINSVLAAIEIQAFMKANRDRIKEEDGEDATMWHLRVGLHTGDVIAGVIGTKRIAYDIWGNTVNVANRMEMSGEPDKVNVSGSTYELIRPYFDCTYRGKVPAKNKGEIDMYFVERIKPHLSEDVAGLVPNQKFKDYVNLHLYSSINYRKAERHIMRILKAKLSPNLHYHGIHHTLDVVEAAERLALMEGVLDDGIFVLKSAATYHDAGFVDQYDANEPVGAKMAAEILPKYGYTQEQVNEVEKMIYATIIPHSPTTQLEEIICDADLDYLGRDDFHVIADNLRRELRDHGKIKSDRMWDEIQVKFLTQHKYFTKSAIKLRQAKKLVHIEEIKKRLEENNYKD